MGTTGRVTLSIPSRRPPPGPARLRRLLVAPASARARSIRALDELGPGQPIGTSRALVARHQKENHGAESRGRAQVRGARPRGWGAISRYAVDRWLRRLRNANRGARGPLLRYGRSGTGSGGGRRAGSAPARPGDRQP